ncbi:MAG TPA: hypothetical protein VFJ00_03145 [Candidatus Limnocylindria bacterium]|nr:hypothetical protein [Candidatus Limnocylindria bacterium]
MAGPGAILAKRALAENTATAVPGAVTPGANVAFDVHFKNTSNSNLSQFFLNAITPDTDDGAALVEVEWASRAGCDDSGPDLHCTFGALIAGAEINLRVVYTTPSSPGTFTVPFNFSTTGVAPDRGGNSHGDDYPTPGIVPLDATLNYGGAYTSTGGQVVTDNQTLSKRQNPQYTQVNAPEAGIAVTVGEATFPCPPSIGTCFGQWSVISVNGGADYSPDGFSVVLGYHGNIGNAKFVHVTDGGAIVELDECSANPAPVLERDPGCYFIDASGSNTIVTIWLVENGRLGGY